MPITVSLRVFGATEAMASLKKLNPNIAKYSKEIAEALATSVQSGARRRAPHWSRTLVESIKAEVIESTPYKMAIGVGVTNQNISGMFTGYAYAQEYGFAGHWIKGSWPTKSGKLVMDWAKDRGVVGRHGREFGPADWLFVRKPYVGSGYFMGPAAMAAAERTDTVAVRAIDRAIQDSGFREG